MLPSNFPAMKTSHYRPFLASLLGLGAAGLLPAANPGTAPADKTDQRIGVIFDHPEKFADVKQDSMGTDKGRDGILDQIREYLEQNGANYLPADLKLAITFTEIDLAGEFEPWRGPQWSDVRIVKDLYPPRFNFSYKLTDSAGKLLKEDKVELRDLSFMMRLTPNRNDPLRFEKDMLNDWLRSIVPPKK
jgi:hypothetical protein